MEKPSLPKGTRDFGPTVMAGREHILNNIRGVFQVFGYLPLETPAMENLSTLTGKYGDEGDQLIFRILNSGNFLKDVPPSKLVDQNSKEISGQIAEKGLRYDLTVPFARYVVMNRHEITLPFKRYQIQPVWRADRPQKGRYREFYQCDADVVGTDSLVCEAEIILIIKAVMKRLQITDYSIKINHRSILNGIAELISAKGKESDLFVAIDKLDKIGEDGVRGELQNREFSPHQIDSLFSLLHTQGENEGKLNSLMQAFQSSDEGIKGVSDLMEVFNLLANSGETDANITFDLTLARGLSYYTGCIFEVKINQVAIGSVSGGGRYDNLTQAFGSKEKLSGVGISFGIDRLYDALAELSLLPAQATTSSRVLVCHFDEATRNFGLRLLASLRNRGIASEIYPETAKLKKQLDYANKKMISYALVIGEEEMQSGNLTLKQMESGDQERLTIEEIVEKLTR